ncbi:acid-sensing ion channel 3-like [Clytia hemisphaerica]|uniref:Uncharacterized protein n=1 Tax=Clytia hemisphaerica TaxID=252671 RepID=A0A7M5VGX6_9CNID
MTKDDICSCGNTKQPTQSPDPLLKTQSELVEEFYSGVTLHGFRFLFEGRWIRRLIWFIICFAVFGFSIYLTYGLFSEFLDRKTSVAISRSYTEQALDFPSVSICPLNVQSKAKMKNLSIDYTIDEFIIMKDKLLFGHDLNPELNITVDQFVNDLEAAGVNNLLDFMKMYQLDFDEIASTDVLAEYLVGGSVCSIYGQDCEDSMFTERIWRHKRCLQFNSFMPGGEPFTARKESDYFTGFQLELDLGGTEYYQSPSAHNGVLLIIENYGNVDDYVPINEIVTVMPGTQMYVKLTENEITMLPSPYATDCREVDFKFVDPKTRYTQGICVIDCIIAHVYEKCGCLGEDYHRILNIPGAKFCKLEEVACYNGERKDALDGVIFKECYKSCPNECTRKSYTVQKSSVKIGTTDVYEYVRPLVKEFKNRTLREIEDYFQNNIMGIHISFFDNVVVSEEMSPAVEWTNLISTMGGAIGLGLGFSFITGFEFLFFIFDLIKLAWQRRQQEQKIEQKPDQGNEEKEKVKHDALIMKALV